MLTYENNTKENKKVSTHSILSFKFFFFRFRGQLTSPEVWLDDFVWLSFVLPSPQDLSWTGGCASAAEISSEEDAFDLWVYEGLRLDSLAATTRERRSFFKVLFSSWNLLHVINRYGLRRAIESFVLDSIKFDTTNSLFCWSKRVTHAENWLQYDTCTFPTE